MSQTPLFPAKLPPTLARPNGYRLLSGRLNTEIESKDSLEQSCFESESTGLDSQSQVPMNSQIGVVHSKKETKTKAVVTVPSAPPPSTHFFYTNIFQLPFVLIVFGFMYSRGLV